MTSLANLINREIRDRYNRSGAGWITSTLLEGRRVLRVTMMNPRSTSAHVRALVDGLLAVAHGVVSDGHTVTRGASDEGPNVTSS